MCTFLWCSFRFPLVFLLNFSILIIEEGKRRIYILLICLPSCHPQVIFKSIPQPSWNDSRELIKSHGKHTKSASKHPHKIKKVNIFAKLNGSGILLLNFHQVLLNSVKHGWKALNTWWTRWCYVLLYKQGFCG